MLKKITSYILVFALVISSIVFTGSHTVSAKSKIKLNKTKATLTVGKSIKLKVKGTKKKVKWSTSNKKVATVSKKGKVTAKKKGTVKIKAKAAGKTLVCKVTVKKKKSSSNAAKKPASPTSSQKPLVTPTPKPQTVAEYYQVLKTYIQKNGYTDQNGDRYIKAVYSDIEFNICYMQNEKTFEFVQVYESKEKQFRIVLGMDIKESDTKKGDVVVDYTCSAQGAAGEMIAVAEVVPGECYNDVPEDFTILSSDFSADASKEYAQEWFGRGMKGWDQLLKDKVRFGMKDLGFTYYFSGSSSAPTPSPSVTPDDNQGPTEEVKAAYDTLKTYINDNGTVGETGDKYISSTDAKGTEYRVYYIPDENLGNCFLFGNGFEEDSDIYVGMEIYESDLMTGSSTVMYIDAESNMMLATADIVLADYVDSSSLNFEIYDDNEEQSKQKFAREQFGLSMSAWDSLLSVCGLNLKSLGFTSYHAA